MILTTDIEFLLPLCDDEPLVERKLPRFELASMERLFASSAPSDLVSLLLVPVSASAVEIPLLVLLPLEDALLCLCGVDLRYVTMETFLLPFEPGVDAESERDAEVERDVATEAAAEVLCMVEEVTSEVDDGFCAMLIDSIVFSFFAL